MCVAGTVGTVPIREVPLHMYYVSVWPSSFFLGFFFLLMFPSSPFTWTVSEKVSGDSSRARRGAGGPLVLLRLLGEAGN